MSAFLEPVRQLAGGGGLTGTLQAGHEDDSRRLRSKLDFGSVVAQDRDQFIAKNLDDLLGRRERGHHLLADGLLLDVIDELLYDLEVDVGLEQRQTDRPQRLLMFSSLSVASPRRVLNARCSFSERFSNID